MVYAGDDITMYNEPFDNYCLSSLFFTEILVIFFKPSIPI